MSIKSYTTPIAFNAGCYGTYLEWALTSLTSHDPLPLPFTEEGSSHLFLGNHLTDIGQWRTYMAGEATHQFVRLHPKSVGDLSLIDNLLTLLSRHNHIIHLFPDAGTYLLTANNQYSKVARDWWQYSFDIDLDSGKIYDNWPIPRHMPIEAVPAWVKREFLSLHYWDMWNSQLEWPDFANFRHPRCCDVSVSELLHNFVRTIERIGVFCQLEFVRPIETLLPAHERMLSLQRHMNEDDQARKLLDAVLTSKQYDSPELSLLTQSWIQNQLRVAGLEMACHGLDKFPTNSVALQTIVYKANNESI